LSRGGIVTSAPRGSIMTAEHRQAVRLRIYLGEEKREGDQPLYQAIIRQARQMRLAGATIIRGTQGYGRSTRLHTSDVLFSDDLPVIVEIVDVATKINAMTALLERYRDIALMTCEVVELRGRRDFEHDTIVTHP
jgi:PII-like signaling protein